MNNKLFYIVAGIFTLNVILNFITGEIYTAIQLSLMTFVLWMWAYLLNNGKE